MANQRQKRKVKKVMHEFKHGELKAGRGRRGTVKNPKQALAIAMSESGQSYKRRGRKRAAAASKTASTRKASPRRKRATSGPKTSSRGPTTRRKTATRGRKKQGR